MTTTAGGLSGNDALLPLNGYVSDNPSVTDGAPLPLVYSNIGYGDVQQFTNTTILNSITATFTTSAAQSLVGTTVTTVATLYLGISPTSLMPTALSCTLSPALTGIVAGGTLETCSASAVGVSVAAGDYGVIVLNSTAAGISLINTVSGLASVSIAP